jgi:hypothetical protein
MFEAGDYTLAGVGTSATSVLFRSILGITVIELDGVDVAPFSLPPVNGSVSFSLPANGVVQPWSLGVSANIAGQLPPGQLATEVEVVIYNTLDSTSERQSISFGSEKDFRLNVGTSGTVDVPETGSTIWLLGGGISVVLLGRRWTLKRDSSKHTDSR